MPAVPSVRRVLRAAAALLVAALVAGPLVAAAGTDTAPEMRSFFVPVAEAPGSAERIRLAVDLYTPATTPAPAVLLAHGFGQSKADVRSEARRLQGEGYVVLAYTARGFGGSGGEIGLDSLDGEVPDARALVDLLARTPTVERQGDDPRVAAVGGSYGGALALMLGATDPRIDTVIAGITWYDLADALAPPSAGRVAGSAPGRDFKSAWASRLFGAGITAGDGPCGRFTPAFCALFQRLVTGEEATPADLELLGRSSPAAVVDDLRVPTLLLQGLQDSLFGLDQADESFRAMRGRADVQVRWFDGGHDGGGLAGTDARVDDWLDRHLRRSDAAQRRFVFDVPAAATSFPETRSAERYPGLAGTAATSVRLRGGTQTVVNPPGGLPAAVTGLPGLGPGTDLGRTASGLLAQASPGTPGAVFTSAPLSEPVLLTGAARVPITIARAAGAGDVAVLYAQLTVRTGDAERPLPGGVAPIRAALGPGTTEVALTLPATAYALAPGDRLVLTLRTSDAQFLGDPDPAAYRVAVAGPIALPTVRTFEADRSAGLPAAGTLIGIAATLLVAIALVVLAAVRSRRAAPGRRAEQAPEGPPLELVGLSKRFRSGFLAVDDVSFTVERGQVLGLLGENGAGKTTTLRMVTGLIRPDSGSVRSFGAAVGPGSPVLARFGTFIEGPGALPHLTGRRNLQLYWATTGRPREEAHLQEALDVADLGAAIDKPVRGYSQGMRQRLAIAQAMLGLPDLLVLDEPTNGLDPPQIAALRGVLQRYAAGGRTVIVSSHLLAEVERTCSHVVVMSHGRVVAAGSVEDVAGDADEVRLTVTDRHAAIEAVQRLPIAGAEEIGADAIRVAPGGVEIAALVAAVVASGAGVTEVSRGRHLEEAFLDLIGATEPSA